MSTTNKPFGDDYYRMGTVAYGTPDMFGYRQNTPQENPLSIEEIKEFLTKVLPEQPTPESEKVVAQWQKGEDCPKCKAPIFYRLSEDKPEVMRNCPKSCPLHNSKEEEEVEVESLDDDLLI